jgi:hypothetical protein
VFWLLGRVTVFSLNFRLFFLALECSSFRDCVSGDDFLEGQFMLGDELMMS